MKKGIACVLMFLLLSSLTLPVALSEIDKSKSTNPYGSFTFSCKTKSGDEIEEATIDSESLLDIPLLAEEPTEIQVMPLIFFPDRNFEQFVREYIGKPEGAITLEDMWPMKEITELTITGEASFLDLSTLSFFEGLTSLAIETVYRADIDLTPIRELQNLTRLVLHTPYAEGVSAIGELRNLTHLDLAGCCDISDISFLRNLTKLTYLDLNSNSIKEISVLSKLTKLEYLNLDSAFAHYYNAAAARKDFTRGVTVERENFTHRIKDISPLRNLVNLQELHLYGNQVIDISPLKGLINLEVLDLGNNNVKDISALNGLTQLTSLNLSNQFPAQFQLDWWENVKNRNKVSDITTLAGLGNLSVLNLENCETVEDLAPLVALVGLTLYPEDLIIPGSDKYAIGTVVITSIASATLRVEDHTDSEMIGKAQPGETYKCVGVSDAGWYMIELQDGQIAYVSNMMAELNEKATGD